MPDITPAERHAHNKGLPMVLVTPHELLGVAAGHPTIFTTTDGGEVLIRLSTVDELLADTARARGRLAGQGLSVPPMPSRARAAEMVAPLQLGG